MVEYGGNLLSDASGNVYQNMGTNVVMATNQISPAITTDCGTSYAAPRVAHKLAAIQGDLAELGLQNPSASLLKAFLCNSASHEFLNPDLDRFIGRIETAGLRHWRNILGYGLPNEIVATNCDDSSVILFFQGAISHDNVVFLDIPIPEQLADSEYGTKEIKITLCYAPEVQRWGLETYLGTTIKWRLFRGDVDRNEIVNGLSKLEEQHSENDGPEEHYLPDELRMKLGITARSRGTVQSDIYQWKRHQRGFSANHYTLAIESNEKWGRTTSDPVPFAVVIRIEDTMGSNIYVPIRNQLANIEVQAAV